MITLTYQMVAITITVAVAMAMAIDVTPKAEPGGLREREGCSSPLWTAREQGRGNKLRPQPALAVPAWAQMDSTSDGAGE